MMKQSSQERPANENSDTDKKVVMNESNQMMDIGNNDGKKEFQLLLE